MCSTFHDEFHASSIIPPHASAHVILPTIPWFHLSPQCLSSDYMQMMDTSHFVQTSQASPAKRKVLGDINNTADSPISPTANLKLLTKVASQFDSFENYVSLYPLKPAIGTPKRKLVKIEETDFSLNSQPKGVRKFKSLGHLCDKFLKLYPLDVPENMHSHILLSDLAKQLGVEKRRIYDIINVVESLQMATKVGKNQYVWMGHKKLVDTLSQLKVYAEQFGLVEYVRLEQLDRKLYLKLHDKEMEPTTNSIFIQNSNVSSFFRNERRIGVLCQKFVMLFLVSLKDGLINLDLAAEVLMGENCQQNKTRLRRLYDIANILVSLGIIEKLDQGGGWKKPVFRYAGPPLHHLEDINAASILSSLVKSELSEITSSDFSEDSNELLWQPEKKYNPLSAAELDHCYCMDITKCGKKPMAVVEPAAKKRLIFSSNLVKKEQPSCEPVKPATPKMPTVLQVMGRQGSEPQPIANGGLYKAVRVGNDMQLIRVDDSSS